MNVTAPSAIVTVFEVVRLCAPIVNSRTPVAGSYVVPVPAV